MGLFSLLFPKVFYSFDPVSNPDLFFGDGEEGANAERQADLAGQAEEVQQIGNTFLAQLIPGSTEFIEFSAFLSDMVLRSGEGAFAVDELGGAVLDQQQAVQQFGAQIVTTQADRISAGENVFPGGESLTAQIAELEESFASTAAENAVLAALGEELDEDALIDEGSLAIFEDVIFRAQQPTEFFSTFTDTLDDQLAILQSNIDASAAQRGILQGGIPITDLGEAGSILTVASAEAEQNAFVQSQAAQQIAFENFQDLLQLGDDIANKGITLEASLLALEAGEVSDLTELLFAQTSNATDDFLTFLDEESDVANITAAQEETSAQAAEDQALTSALELIGITIGGAVAGPPGAAVGGATGAAAGTAVTGGPGDTPDLATLLSETQTATSPSGDLSVQLGAGIDPFSDVLKQFLGSPDPTAVVV